MIALPPDRPPALCSGRPLAGLPVPSASRPLGGPGRHPDSVVHDLAAGEVGAGRVLTHVAAVFGLVLLLVLDRNERALPPGRRRTELGDQSGADRLRGVA